MQAPDQRNRDGAPGSVKLPRIRPTAVDGIRTGATPAPAEDPAPAATPSEPNDEVAPAPPAPEPPPAPAAPRPIAVVPAAPAAPVAPAAAPAAPMTVRLHPETLALLTMLVPAGVAAAWTLTGAGRRPGAE